MLGGGEMMRAFNIAHYVGVFDAHMTRVYRLMGVGPEVLGTIGTGRQAISVGLWHYDARLRDRLLARAGLSSELSELWFNRAFGTPVELALSA
jgi:acyl homoserine lactone synthase